MIAKTKSKPKSAAKAAKSTKKALSAARAAVDKNLKAIEASESGAKPKKAKAETKAKKVSAIDAAAKVLTGAKEPMNCKELIEAMGAKGLWTSPGGKTPHATLYSAILREINAKGKDARFTKAERGKFAAKA